jgi:DNA-binding PadR family transcriptional regulator
MDGLISSTKEIDRRKFYLITKTGQLILLEEAKRIKEIYKNLEGLL